MSDVLQVIEARLRSNPDDRSSWLVYADYLLDHGDVRGELIQMWGRANDPDLPEKARASARTRVRAIEDSHRKRWLDGWPFEGRSHLLWRYGFVVGISFGAADCDLKLLDALARHGTARLLAQMSIGHRYAGDDKISAIAGAEIFRQIGALNLERNYLHARTLRVLGERGALSGLRSLNLCENPLGSDGIEVLTAVRLERLAQLYLAGCGIDAEALRLLAASDNMPALASLNLRRNPLGDLEAIRALRSRGIVLGLNRP